VADLVLPLRLTRTNHDPQDAVAAAKAFRAAQDQYAEDWRLRLVQLSNSCETARRILDATRDELTHAVLQFAAAIEAAAPDEDVEVSWP
jgi:hypothetical protein